MLRERWDPSRGRRLAAPGAAVLLVALLSVPFVTAAAPTMGAEHSTAFVVHKPVNGGEKNFSYNASSDGFPLSYVEILPAGYNASKTYPLIVYLHGKGTNSNWTRGGAGNGLSNYLTVTGLSGTTLRGLISNASSFGFILISPSPRTQNGFYVNSPCGGPQAQDTLDAIAHEKALRNISSVYLLGFSMGSLGALSLAGHHPGMFAGIAVSGTMTDPFEELAYRPTGDTNLLGITCNVAPSATNTSTAALYKYLGVTRFAPTNFSGLRIWVSAGGMDISAPNNASRWPFQMVNDTFLHSNCTVATSYGEPANCTVPFQTLRSASPGLYPFRFIFEAKGTHLLAQFSPRDVYLFLLGKEGGGCFDSSFPPTTFKSCP